LGIGVILFKTVKIGLIKRMINYFSIFIEFLFDKKAWVGFACQRDD